MTGVAVESLCLSGFKMIYEDLLHLLNIMKNLLITLLVVICLTFQTAAQEITTHEAPSTVVSAMLAEPYIAAILSLVLLIATLI